MLTAETTTDIATKASIGVTGSIYAALKMPLSSWVALATLVYMVCQLIVITPKVISVLKSFVKKRKK